jgi:trehalose 6-phosphate phosphatase
MSSVLTESPLLVVSDLDGTLSPIAPTPQLATWVEGAVAVLDHLSRLPQVALAIVTGRALDDVLDRTRGIGPTWLVCEHGAVVRDPTGRVSGQSLEPREKAALDAAAAHLELYGHGAYVERKQCSIAVHLRGCPPEVHEQTLELVLYLAESTPHVRLEVIEMRPGQPSKRAAVEHLISELSPRALLAAGDDAPDVPMLSLVQQVPCGRAYLIRSDEGPLPPAWVHTLPSPRAWVRLLARLVRRREAMR